MPGDHRPESKRDKRRRKSRREKPAPRTYRRLRRIGQGSYGVVDLVQGEDGIIKVMKSIASKKGDGASAKELENARKEAEMLATLDHPNIVRFHEAFLTNKGTMLCIVMQYCESGDLHSRIERARQQKRCFKERTIMEWFVQMSLALQYLHSKNILHRDIKPQNVFLTENNKVVKLGDFGVTKALDNSNAMANTQVGTPYYMSPELAHSEPYNAKSDVWALGCVLYQCCAHRVPFTADSFAQLIFKITDEDPPPLNDSLFSSDLQKLIRAMLRKSARKRASLDQVLGCRYVQGHVRNFAHRHKKRSRSRRGRSKSKCGVVDQDAVAAAGDEIMATDRRRAQLLEERRDMMTKLDAAERRVRLEKSERGAAGTEDDAEVASLEAAVSSLKKSLAATSEDLHRIDRQIAVHDELAQVASLCSTRLDSSKKEETVAQEIGMPLIRQMSNEDVKASGVDSASDGGATSGSSPTRSRRKSTRQPLSGLSMLGGSTRQFGASSSTKLQSSSGVLMLGRKRRGGKSSRDRRLSAPAGFSDLFNSQLREQWRQRKGTEPTEAQMRLVRDQWLAEQGSRQLGIARPSTAEQMQDAIVSAADSEMKLRKKLSTRFIDVSGRQPTADEMVTLIDRLTSSISRVDKAAGIEYVPRAMPTASSSDVQHGVRSSQRRERAMSPEPAPALASGGQGDDDIQMRLAQSFRKRLGREPTGKEMEKLVATFMDKRDAHRSEKHLRARVLQKFRAKANRDPTPQEMEAMMTQLSRRNLHKERSQRKIERSGSNHHLPERSPVTPSRVNDLFRQRFGRDPSPAESETVMGRVERNLRAQSAGRGGSGSGDRVENVDKLAKIGRDSLRKLMELTDTSIAPAAQGGAGMSGDVAGQGHHVRSGSNRQLGEAMADAATAAGGHQAAQDEEAERERRKQEKAERKRAKKARKEKKKKKKKEKRVKIRIGSAEDGETLTPGSSDMPDLVAPPKLRPVSGSKRNLFVPIDVEGVAGAGAGGSSRLLAKGGFNAHVDQSLRRDLDAKDRQVSSRNLHLVRGRSQRKIQRTGSRRGPAQLDALDMPVVSKHESKTERLRVELGRGKSLRQIGAPLLLS